MAVERVCDICHRSRKHPTTGETNVRPYSVVRQITATERDNPALRFALKHVPQAGEKRTTYGAGAIDLCEECWTRIAKPKMKPQRRRPDTRPAVA